MSTETTHIETEIKLVPALRFKEFEGEWNKKKIREVLTIGSGKDYKHLEAGIIPVYGTGGLMAKVNTAIHSGKTVFIGRKGSIDKPFYYDGDFWTVDTLFYTHSFQESEPYFIYGLFQKINWYKHNEASGVPSLSKTTIGSLVVNLPSLPEQQKIASFLSAVDKKIQQLTKKKTLLEQFKKGVMQQLFSGQRRFKDENGNPYPDWEEKLLGEVADVTKLAGFEFTKHIVYRDNGKIIALRGLNIKKNTLDLDQVKYIDDSDFTKLNRSKLFIGDLMYTYVGTIGEVAIIEENDRFYLAPNVSRIRFNEDECLVKFAMQYFINPIFKEREVGKYISSSSQPALSMTNIRKFKILLPSIEEQQKIATYLSRIDTKIESVNNQITQTQTFKKGLLQQMFV
jgi:type I restriction enzyme S subunit